MAVIQFPNLKLPIATIPDPETFLPDLQKFKYAGKVFGPLGVFLDIMENRHTISLTE